MKLEITWVTSGVKFTVNACADYTNNRFISISVTYQTPRGWRRGGIYQWSEKLRSNFEAGSVVHDNSFANQEANAWW